MTLTELKEELVEFFKQKGIIVYNINAQIEMGLDFVPEIHMQFDAFVKE